MPDCISIIIPNLHSPVIGQTLASLRAQDFAGEFEVIVVGQDKPGRVTEDERTRFIRAPQPVAPAVARNLGIRAARGDVLAFLDADCTAAPDWLTRLSAPYADPEVAVVGGSVDFPDDNYWTLCDNVATFYEFLSTSVAGTRELLPSLNLSVRASVLREVGLFDERYPFPAGEDADLTTRLRLRDYVLHFEPRARVTHHPQRSRFSAVVRHAYNFGRYSVKVDPRYQAGLKVSGVLRHEWVVLLCAPALAASVTARVVLATGWRYWTTWPVVFVAKWIWCFGAARTLRRGTAFE
jgi:cellulose synthase/poly-beta-1,6-N-acetylglucosamine synthase-like glycosyltransferase